jgi:lipopolysaccharide export system protein LptC
VRTFDPDGTLRRELSGVEGRHYPDTDTLEIEKPRIRALSDSHSEVVATAERALSNGDGSEVQLFDNAVVTRAAERSSAGKITPELQFRGDFLDVFTNTERVSSNRPVILTRGKDRFTADAMDYDNLTQVANLRGRVRGQIFPQVAGSAQGSVSAAPNKSTLKRTP